jgi:hypothetical protein
MPAWFIDENEVKVSGKSEEFCTERQNFGNLNQCTGKFKGWNRPITK